MDLSVTQINQARIKHFIEAQDEELQIALGEFALKYQGNPAVCIDDESKIVKIYFKNEHFAQGWGTNPEQIRLTETLESYSVVLASPECEMSIQLIE